MEPLQQQQQQHHPNEDGKGSFVSRQSSTRWTPTTDQIRILKDLYYNNGVRSPSTDQIQKISARLRQYGKIEGKNVFYWFQNHKARERQKKRFTTTTTDHHHHHHHVPIQKPTVANNKYPTISPGYTPSYAFFDKKKFIEEDDEVDFGTHIETLPLFPMHGEDINAFCSNVKHHQSESCNSAGWYSRSDDGYIAASRASLELSLNSYTARSHDE